MKFKLSISFVFLLVVSICNAQIDNKACKEKILKYYRDLALSLKKNSGKTFFVEMDYTSWMNEKGKQGIMVQKTVNSKVKMYLFGKRSCYQNEQMEVYKDEMEIFTVLNSDKIILKSIISSDLQNQQANMLNFFKDSVINSSEVTDCKKASGIFGANVLEIKYMVATKYQKLLKADEFILYFDEKLSKILAMEIYYLPGYAMNKQIIKYTKQEFLNINLLKKPVNTNFLDKNGRLLAKYQSYRLIDSSSSK